MENPEVEVSSENSLNYDNCALQAQDKLKKDHLLQWMSITVGEPEKRSGGPSVKMQDAYIVYLVETKGTDEKMPGYLDPPTSVWRRYSDFELLRTYLEVMFPAVVIPPLPEKRVTHTWINLPTDRFDDCFIERRRYGLENFVLRVASHSQLSQDKIFHAFLKQEEGWKETALATDFYSKGDSKLKTATASYRVRLADRRFEELKNYSNELERHITNILKIRARLCDKVYSTQKVHQNYARIFKEWSAIETDMGPGLSDAAQYMDMFARSIDGLMDEEEQFAEHFKEYCAFAESLRTICRKQETLQLDVEKSEESVNSKAYYRDQVAQGKESGFSLTGMKSRLFGAETPEQKQQRLKQLDDEIKGCEALGRQRAQELEEFVEQSLRDVERFQRQKTKDLKDVFTSYAIMQIDRCKKGITVWQNTKECFAKM